MATQTDPRFTLVPHPDPGILTISRSSSTTSYIARSAYSPSTLTHITWISLKNMYSSAGVILP